MSGPTWRLKRPGTILPPGARILYEPQGRPGFDRVDGREVVRVQTYMEYMGGLGDLILRLYSSRWYRELLTLPVDHYAGVTTICYNKYAGELWPYHPLRDRLVAHSLDPQGPPPFPWRDKAWRAKHDLPNPICAWLNPPFPKTTFYPWPEDWHALDELAHAGDYVVFACTSGKEYPPLDCRSIPAEIRESAAKVCLDLGFKVVPVGRSSFFRLPREWDILPREGVLNMVDRLTVPGTLVALQRARAVICAHSSICLASWCDQKPTFTMYPANVAAIYARVGPKGLMFGMEYPEGGHAEFKDYTPEKLAAWLRTIPKGA